MDEIDCNSINLFDEIDTLQRSVLGRGIFRITTDHAISQEGPADVFIVKTTLDGLRNSEQYSDTSQPSWVRWIWRYIIHRVATNSRTTHWAAEIRGDLYETFRLEEHWLPWQWTAIILMTAAEDIPKQPEKKEVERVLIGTTALCNNEIASRGNNNLPIYTHTHTHKKINTTSSTLSRGPLLTGFSS